MTGLFDGRVPELLVGPQCSRDAISCFSQTIDIYSEETASPDDKGNVLHIYSENRKIRELLLTLFYDTLNVDFNLTMWVRNLCKYGDFFLFY